MLSQIDGQALPKSRGRLLPAAPTSHSPMQAAQRGAPAPSAARTLRSQPSCTSGRCPRAQTRRAGDTTAMTVPQLGSAHPEALLLTTCTLPARLQPAAAFSRRLWKYLSPHTCCGGDESWPAACPKDRDPDFVVPGLCSSTGCV